MLCNPERFPSYWGLSRDIRCGGGQTIWRGNDEKLSLSSQLDFSHAFARGMSVDGVGHWHKALTPMALRMNDWSQATNRVLRFS